MCTWGSGIFEDERDGPVVWLALASLQLEADALDPAVAERARDSIEPSLAIWRDEAAPAGAEARAAELERVRQQVGSSGSRPR